MLLNIIEKYKRLDPYLQTLAKIVFASGVGFFGVAVVMTGLELKTTSLVLMIIVTLYATVIIFYCVLGAIAHKHAWIINALAMCQKNCISVELIDFEKTHSYSMAYQQKNGEIFCYVYPIQKIGLMKLAEDGTVSDINGHDFYVEKWIPLNKVDRVEHILRNS